MVTFLLTEYLAGRVALVTGSTGGIGEGVARCLAQRGANIVLNGFGDDRMIQNLLKSFKRSRLHSYKIYLILVLSAVIHVFPWGKIIPLHVLMFI